MFPTDTVYGIGTRPDDHGATDRLFRAKGRPRALELPVLAPSIASAKVAALFDERAERLAEAWWPGALTLVLPRSEASSSWDLGGDHTTIGLRIPDHMLALTLLGETGPLAVTSANRSGEPTPESCDGLVETFGDLVAVFLCQETAPPGTPSTVLDLAHGEPRVLREGSVEVGAVRETLDRTRRRWT